jgi:hypothetical protein
MRGFGKRVSSRAADCAIARVGEGGHLVSGQLFKPENMARGMMTLYPDLAGEIALSLMNDAMMIGESARALLWWDVLVRIGRLQEEERVRVH